MTRWKGRERLESLRAVVARIERGVVAPDGVLPLGMAVIDRVLGEGGLRVSALHEVAGPAADGFAAVLAGWLVAQRGGTVLWCTGVERWRALHPPGLATLGLAPTRLLLVRCRNQTDLLAAAEEGLRTAGLAAVVVETARSPAMGAARRLQLAAETGGVTGLLLCHLTGGRPGARAPGNGTPAALPPSPVVSRWYVDPAPGRGGVRWQLALRRCRGGGSGQWMVDWNEKTRRLAVVSPAGD